MLETWHFRGSDSPALFQSYEGTILLLRSAQTLTLGANATCLCPVCARARARAGNQPWRLLCGEKIHRPPSLFSPVLNTSDRWSFQYNLAEGALGLLRVECHVFPHRVRVRQERGITKCRSFTKHESRQFPSLSPAEAGSVRAEVGGAMSAQGCNRICEARARKEKAT